MHPANPEGPPAPTKSIVRAWLYHPLLSGARLALASTSGGVASYLKLTEAPLGLPAWSEQLPLTVTEAESGPV